MTRKLDIPSKHDLESSYTSSISDLARKYGTSNPTVRKWLRQYGIPIRSHQEASKIANSKRMARKPDRASLARMLRSRPELLSAIDAMAARRGMSRNAIIFS